MNWNILGKAAFCSAGFILVVLALIFLFSAHCLSHCHGIWRTDDGSLFRF